MAKVKCSECGRLVKNAYYINGKAYGYNCYKQKLMLIYKQWEDEKNAEYIINVLNANKLSDENFICAKEIYYSMDETIELESIAHSLLDFLMINNKTDDLLFKNVVNNYLSTDSEIEEI